MRVHSFLVLSAVIVFAVPGFTQGSGPSDGSPTVVMSLGKPNVWTLEQAHYLLEKNRAHDLGIAAADLGPLDSNETVGFRIDAIKTLFNAQVQFDQSVGAKNNAGMQQFRTDSLRFNELRRQLDELRPRQARLAGQVAAAQFDVDTLQAKSKDKPDDKSIQQQLDQAQSLLKGLTSEKQALDNESASLTTAIGSEPQLSVTSTLPTDSTTSILGSNATFDKLLGSIPSGLTQSKLGASIRLDNFINMQYEIVAKQLTLLRDEAGPDNLVLFVELPQSIYATQKLKLYPDFPAMWGHHLAQSWWRVKDLQLAEPNAEPDSDTSATEKGTKKQDKQDVCATENEKNDQPNGTGQGTEAEEKKLTGRHDEVPPPNPAQFKELRKLAQNCSRFAAQLGVKAKSNDNCPASFTDKDIIEQWVGKQNSLLCTDREKYATWLRNWSFPPLSVGRKPKEKDLLIRDQLLEDTDLSYALDLIPRQSALNVAEAHSVSRSYGFAGLFGWLSGFGARARYERQHDQYDQFVQQEVFASAFGKGEREFGWTFGPLPGTKRLAPGLRTTYAVIVVPRYTRTFTLEGYGCAFRRRAVPANPFAFEDGDKQAEGCREKVNYSIVVPSSRESFWVRKIYYKPVRAGQRVTVEIDGDFTPQIGVLVNGSPLQKVVSIGQPIVEQASFNVPANAGDSTTQGVFEAVGKSTLILSFITPATFIGTPRIALVTPSKAMVINGFTLKVNSVEQSLDNAAPMFYQPTSIIGLTADYCKTGCGNAKDETALLNVYGWHFTKQQKENPSLLLLNGKQLKPAADPNSPRAGEYTIVNDSLVQITFNRSDNFPHWRVDAFLHYPNGEQVTFSKDDDGPMRDDLKCEVIKPVKAKKGDPQNIELSITGSFVNPAFTPSGIKSLSLTTTSYDPDKQSWHLVGTVADPITAGAITFKGTPTPTQIPLSICSGIDKLAGGGSTPPKKTVAKKTKKKKVA